MLEALAIAAPLVLAGERSFFHIPQPAEVRIQRIARTDNERDWPFSVDEGNLTCVWSTGQKLVFFFENQPEELDQPDDFRARGVMVTVNPFDLTVGNMANRALFVPVASVADLIRRIAPYVDVGQRLCDQPPGAIIGHGEL
jgi:hypothetical protein